MSARCFDMTISDTSACLSFSVRASAFGKKTTTPLAEAVRLIVPMSSEWRILDVVVSERVQAWIGSLGSLPDGCMECGVRGSGAQQAVLGARLVVEKSLEGFSRGALLQADIKQYYDHLDPVACARWMLDKGCPRPLAAAAVRHQLCPEVFVKIGSFTAEVGQRARGPLTWSRTAGALGRIPIRYLHEHIAATCWARAYGPPGHEVLLSTYVDNVMVAAKDDTSAEAILRAMRTRLHDLWRLELPESSVELLLPRGAAPPSHGRPAWSSLGFWGTEISSDGSLAACWGRAQGAARAALWRHMRAARSARLSRAQRARIVDVFV